MDKKAEEVWSNHNPVVHEREITTIKTSLQMENPKVYTKVIGTNMDSYVVLKKGNKKFGMY